MKTLLKANCNKTENRVMSFLNNITLTLSKTKLMELKTCKMKKYILIFLFLISFISKTQAQCSVYIQMVSAVECLLPMVVSSQQILSPCSAPTGFYQLTAGEYAYIDYTPSSCITTCQQGPNIDITCFSQTVGVEYQEVINEIKIFPTLFQSVINIKGDKINKIEIYDVSGTQFLELKNINSSIIDLSFLNKGVYLIKLITNDQIIIKKIVKV